MVIQNGDSNPNSTNFLMGAGIFTPRNYTPFPGGTPVVFKRGNAITYSLQIPGRHSTVVMFCRTDNKNNSKTYDNTTGEGFYPNETPMHCLASNHTRDWVNGGHQKTKYLYIQFPRLTRNKFGDMTLQNSSNGASFTHQVTEDLLILKFK